jgi:hypothetical protein
MNEGASGGRSKGVERTVRLAIDLAKWFSVMSCARSAKSTM